MRAKLVLGWVAAFAIACSGGPDVAISDAPTVGNAAGAEGDTSAAAAPEPDDPDVAAVDGTDVEPSATEVDGSIDPSPAGELVVHYLDVGQGDATLLQHADATVLIDTGRHQGSEVVPALRAAGVETIDLVVVTHPHADHVGQFDQVLDSFTVTEVWWSGSTTTTQTFDRALAALERSDAAYEEPRTGDTALIGPLELEVINPPAGTALDDLHDANLALRVTYGEVRFLFTGDAEAATEARMTAVSAAILDADILQLGHHGSRTSTTPAFLAAVDPAVAIYSASTGNQYGHPHGEVLDRVLAAGVEVFGTAVHGTVTITTDGEGWAVETQRTGTPVAGDATSGAGAGGSAAGGSAAGGSAAGGSAAGSDTDSQASSSPAPASGRCEQGQVDINSAGVDDLQRIVEIGPDRAQQILQLRPFPSVSAMDRISGIGPARLEQIVAQGVACAS
jgi:competence protein ComEC